MREYDHLGARYLEFERFDDAAMINGRSTESVYKAYNKYMMVSGAPHFSGAPSARASSVYQAP